MSNLQQFLNAHPIDNLTDEVVISERFKGEDGKRLKFKIKAMSNRDFDDIRRQSMEIRKNKKVELDLQKFNSAIIINHTLEPDFKDAASIQATGSLNPEEYLNKVLLAGEIAELSMQIQRLSGFDQDMDELVNEAKN
ncbi:XkdN-like protein [Paenibacillus sp. IB182496]|uniref:XkdN-like protein n=1 Tax=Paenibacillus sabuli TaxID=2772509 RepID=A0A927BV23_9BACL|nr:XkdN-like protein [Paenibacillus sabuli]MBD2846190.1 XkdN-like protein [Paenibacillus sabuli]